jgi:nucleoside-diphosphate-sugar epimerase
MRVLITGGTGFVGYWMAKTQPEKVTAFYSDSADYALNWDNSESDAIVHLAPISPARVLAYAKAHNTRVLFASSGAVYEQHTEYAENKRMWEQECLDSGADVVIARLFSFVGAHLNRHAVYEFIQMAKAGNIKVRSPWSQRSYLYGEDLGRWLWKILLAGKGVYDVGGSVEYNMLSVASIVSSIVPSKVTLINDQPATSYIPDLIRAYLLGCHETYSLKEAIERTVNECG